MRTRLQNKLQTWKNRLAAARRQLRRLRSKLYWSCHRIKKQEACIAELERLIQPQPIAGHTYPAQMVVLAIFMVAQAGVSLRAAAKTITFFAHLMGWKHYQKPSHVTVLRWVLRAGLYELQRAANQRPPDAKYVGILDKSIALGGEKFLLLLGVRVPPEGLASLAALTHTDVEVLAMQVSPSWGAEEIGTFLQGAIGNQTGQAKLDYVITDGGTNLIKALREATIDRVNDCTHVLMNLVKKWYADDARLSVLCAEIGKLRRQNTLGRYGYIVPPTLRDKDRFLRVFTLVDWAAKIKDHWNELDEQARARLTFLTTHAELLAELNQVRHVVAQTGKVFKRRGMNDRSIKLWRWLLDRYATAGQPVAALSAMIAALEEYVTAHDVARQKYGGHLLCCSDIIESVFGRYKNKGGVKAISADILKIPLYRVELTCDYVVAALESVSYQDVYAWEMLNTCPTRFGQLRALRRRSKPARVAA